MKSGFVTIVGRPNAGKSTLLNHLIGTKVSIVSDKAQTTRTQVRGILNNEDSQVVFVDTPGIGKPRTTLGSRLNDAAYDSLSAVDVVLFVVDGTKPVGTGDRQVAERLTPNTLVVLNKVDRMSKSEELQALAGVAEFEFAEFFPISARTGEGADVLLDAVISRLPEGPRFYEPDVISETPEDRWVAELVREELLAVTHDELPHSIATTVTEWEWPRVRVEISVERESQKSIVIGKRGEVLKEVGTRVRAQLEAGMFLELFVKVNKDWQRNPNALDRLGY